MGHPKSAFIGRLYFQPEAFLYSDYSTKAQGEESSHKWTINSGINHHKNQTLCFMKYRPITVMQEITWDIIMCEISGLE